MPQLVLLVGLGTAITIFLWVYVGAVILSLIVAAFVVVVEAVTPPIAWFISVTLPYYLVILGFSAFLWFLTSRIQKFVVSNPRASMLSIIMRVVMIISLIPILILILTVWFDGHISSACDDIMNTVACSSITMQYENSWLTPINSFFNPLRSLFVLKDPVEEAEMLNIAAIFYVIFFFGFRFSYLKGTADAAEETVAGKAAVRILNGYHRYTYDNGSKYVGEWKDGKHHGQGTATFSSGGKYVGEWKDGVRTGQGTYTSPDGDKYVGEFKVNRRHGFGTNTTKGGVFSRSTIEKGIWKNDKFIGEMSDK